MTAAAGTTVKSTCFYGIPRLDQWVTLPLVRKGSYPSAVRCAGIATNGRVHHVSSSFRERRLVHAPFRPVTQRARICPSRVDLQRGYPHANLPLDPRQSRRQSKLARCIRIGVRFCRGGFAERSRIAEEGRRCSQLREVNPKRHSNMVSKAGTSFVSLRTIPSFKSR